MVKPLALIVAALLSLAACGSEPTSNSSSSGELDRSDVEDVAVAMLTAVLESDFDTVRELVLPDQRDAVETLEQAARARRARADELGSPPPDVEVVNVEATVIEQEGTTAIVDYSGEYCLPETTEEVPVTAVGSEGEDAETIPGRARVVTEPERCVVLDEIFQTDRVEYALIDGEWYAPLPE